VVDKKGGPRRDRRPPKMAPPLYRTEAIRKEELEREGDDLRSLLESENERVRKRVTSSDAPSQRPAHSAPLRPLPRGARSYPALEPRSDLEKEIGARHSTY